ncbi:putative mitochondrial maoc family dehydratase-like protein [Leptomonas pyrrhocoris]|uniref:Putative mitochondrial maoc family dehydratase-like protein n=1 Tax=Leptomonas pyrrhocoris TaxID=157538 RepID=A0A0M9FR71_LEPPY|nr:putative mitochondrial maoc family dehydratase-like protein [Leptomonas pyrrhocoris]XP_015652787.1 putative mitochondrial maoc family dehydratase-like protein [Leptomonas pyrrhocoris]KPA74347.1 putative mitochondrial maoc family dehydratase-like protein [Leptomonas pyrrhocoris]KPA74348.1 putative mitochondrial maoc family dehydratase-like protein [Leptomonas pyrrhocoris]|eukprot:XP_015652786.1 putative mitochondrial maoc family dehydratase-like protein [Leptomonas pyrrhocoris]
MSTETTPTVVRIGARAIRSFHITQESVTAFGNLVDDHNPIHSDPAAAKAAGFPSPICYGMFAGSLFSGLMAQDLPGPGSIYLSQNLRFTAPVFVGDDLEVIVEVKEFHKDKGLISLANTAQKTDPATGKAIVCITGSSVVMNKTLQFEGESTWTAAK